MKGAPDDVLALRDRFQRDDGDTVAALDADAMALLRDRCRALERRGLRVLGVAWRDVPADHPTPMYATRTRWSSWPLPSSIRQRPAPARPWPRSPGGA